MLLNNSTQFLLILSKQFYLLSLVEWLGNCDANYNVSNIMSWKVSFCWGCKIIEFDKKRQ